MQSQPVARGMAVPVQADSVDAPIVTYSGPALINFTTADERWGRVTFEKLDSIRISRGEYLPYEEAESESARPAGTRTWVYTVEHSLWLRERYEYEKLHYGSSYEWGGDVNEMLTDFSHYLFRFHDQFVEVIATGIWFETAGELLGERELEPGHPFADLPETSIAERFEAHGISCQVRRNHRPVTELVEDAALCSQKLLQLSAELEGSTSVDWTVTLRARDGVVRSFLRSYFGKVEERFDGIATLDDVRPRIVRWLGEVHERRRQMGKA